MEPVSIVIDGANFSTLDEFYTEMERILTGDLGWRPGRSLDAFNDLLRGGFGVHEYGQPLDVRWVRSEKSRRDLGYAETERYWTQLLGRCHPSNRERVQEKLDAARRGEGKTLFDMLVDIILDSGDSGRQRTLTLDEAREGRDVKKCRSIAIDGPSGAGKSTLARALAGELGFIYLDTGAIYRTVGLFALRRGADPADAGQVAELLPELRIRMTYGSDGLQHMLLGGEDVTGAIRAPEVSVAASKVSAVPAVRAFLLDMQREMARNHNVVMDGRDIGTVVLPEADVKIFLTAAPEERARRRCDELLERGEQADYESVLRDVVERDERDTSRAASPLRQAEDAAAVDTTGLSLEESLRRLLALVKERLHE